MAEEKVITDKDGAVFHLCGTAIIMNRGDVFTWNNPVPVFDSSNSCMGFADVVEEEGRLVATLFVKYDMPERLNIQNDEPLYIRPVFSTPTSFTSLYLGANDPIDSRILPVRVLP